ncbi:MAG TPA: hypothetical protein VFW22_09625 [Pseudolabrys sp.]|nr:hypothetical protein [Pseudolabrys sp.]
MTTFPLRAQALPNVQIARPALARIAAVFASMAGIIAEAGRQANAAHKRLSWR